uniref:Helicase C-terminal domain-containing protein n=1 Tax=Panagrolaimus superbus TaxID=310955 RepID=A0A914XZ89_9BILA
MHFPQWVDLKGQDVAPDTVHQIVCMVDPIADKSWIRIRSKRGSSIQTDGIHEKDKIYPGSEEQETLSEGVKVLKGEYVVKAIRQFDMDQCIIFCRTKLDCDNLEAYLKIQQKDWSCACLHADRSPDERTANLKKFKEGEVRFLICTDVAARGIDVRGIPYVINMTLPPPEDKSSYLHRIGRVGRAERMGLALSFVATVPEKVWYHQCRQRTCSDTRRCAIWYDEISVS